MTHRTPTTSITEASVPVSRTPYFVYGSLMSSNLLFSIIGPEATTSPTAKALKTNQMTRATLYQHRRHVVQWADFPAIIKTGNPEDFVEGLLVSGLTELQEERIKRYESGLYTDEDVEVVMGWGKTLGERRKARVYVWGGSKEELMDPAVMEWSFKKFKESRRYKMKFGGGGESDDEV